MRLQIAKVYTTGGGLVSGPLGMQAFFKQETKGGFFDPRCKLLSVRSCSHITSGTSSSYGSYTKTRDAVRSFMYIRAGMEQFGISC